jgi:ribosome-binding factor A
VSQRTEKVQKVARQVLGEAIQSLKDPRIGFTTITAVRISPDLRNARILVSVLGTPDAQQLTMAGLNSAKPVLRAELGRQVRMKYLPELTFELDHGAEEADRIEQLIHQIHSDHNDYAQEHPTDGEPEDDTP